MSRIDRTETLVAITFEHHRIHNGEMWGLFDNATGVNIVTPRNWIINTPAGAPVHFEFALAATNGFLLELFEDTTTSADGTTLAAQVKNLNRVVPVTAVPIGFFHTPTVTGDGTRIDAQRAGGGAGGTSVRAGGQAKSDLEFVLEPSTKYMIRVTVAVDSTTVTLSGDFYLGV